MFPNFRMRSWLVILITFARETISAISNLANFIVERVSAQWTRYVMVKIWEVPKIYQYNPGDNKARLMDEVILLRHEMLINHRGMVKLYGYCVESDHLGVVYELNPFDSVFNLILKDGFIWLQRIKVALGFAFLLEFLHSAKCSFHKPFIVRNLDCAHIVVDEEFNPKLCDFGLITGGILPDRTKDKRHVFGSLGYLDIDSYFEGGSSGKQDVFAFGVMLLNLISKRVYEVEDRRNAEQVYEWALREFDAFKYDETSDKETLKFSLVHQSLTTEPDFDPADAEEISKLVIECIDTGLPERPTMKQVVRSLIKLRVVEEHADYLQVNKARHSV